MKVCFYCTSASSLIKSNLHNGKLLHFHVSNSPPLFFFSFSLLLASASKVLFMVQAVEGRLSHACAEKCF